MYLRRWNVILQQDRQRPLLFFRELSFHALRAIGFYGITSSECDLKMRTCETPLYNISNNGEETYVFT